MGKPRRPKGGRSNWEPKPPLDVASPAPTESLPEASDDASSTGASAAPEAAPVAPAALRAESEAESPDGVAHGANPPEADQAIPDERPAADRAPDLVPAAVAIRDDGSPAPHRIVSAPERVDIVEIGSTIARYVQGEGAAALAHFRALSDVRTPADLIRLQVGEVQRAADASLTCWVTVMGKASRIVALR